MRGPIGPDAAWLEDAHATCPAVEIDIEELPPEAEIRLEMLQRVLPPPQLAALDGASDHLLSHVRARMVDHELRSPDEGELPLLEILEDAQLHGVRSLAVEAEEYATRLSPEARAGSSALGRADMVFSQADWSGGGQVGCSTVDVMDERLYVFDYSDKVIPPEGVRAPLGLAEGEPEDRQCLCLHLAAATLIAEAGDPPAVEDVAAAAQELRADLWDGAVEAHAALGDPPPWVTQAEADVRSHVHDALNAHHDKDYRCFQMFPAKLLENAVLHVWRVSHGASSSSTFYEGHLRATTFPR